MPSSSKSLSECNLILKGIPLHNNVKHPTEEDRPQTRQQVGGMLKESKRSPSSEEKDSGATGQEPHPALPHPGHVLADKYGRKKNTLQSSEGKEAKDDYHRP